MKGRFLHGAALTVFVLSSVVLYLGCPTPITQLTVNSARDTMSPTIAISSPAEYSSYSRTIVIAGTVRDFAAAGLKGAVASLRYEILARTAAKDVAFDASGSFTITEPTDLRENITIQLTAVDWNGNTTTTRLPLTWAGNEIPSFASAEGNRQTVLSWSPVPAVTSYTLYVEPSALAPSPASSVSIKNVASPYTMTQLKNGSVYTFLLEGTTADGRKNYSTVVRAVPLSTFNLFPRVTSHFDSIEVAWRTFSGIGQYEVMRSTSPGGPYQSVSGPVAGPPFSDAGVVQGMTYYYAVKPAQYSAVVSEYAEAQADVVPSRSNAKVATFEGTGNAQAAVYLDGYLYVADYNYGLRVVDVHQPALPLSAANLAISGGLNAIAISGNYAYLSSNQGLVIVDVSNRTSPTLVGQVTIPSVSGFQGEGVAVLGNLVFIAGFNDGFAVVDATVKSAPVVRLSNQDGALFGQNLGIDAQDRSGTKILAVVGLNATALYTVSGTDASPTITRRSSTMSGGYRGRFSGTVFYLAGSSGGWGLSAYDTTTLTSPAQLGSAVTPQAGVAAAEQVAISGNRAYVSLRDYGLSEIDISTPASMSVAQTYTVPGSPEGIAIGGGYSYICAGQGYGVAIYGTGNVSAMRVTATMTDVNTGARLAAYRDMVYVSENVLGDWQAAGYTVATPAAASRIWTSGVYGYTPYAFTFVGNHALLAAERSGIMMWDTTVPSSPGVVAPGYVNVPGGYAWSVAVSGQYALIGTSSSYLDVIDLSYPNNMVPTGSVQTQGTVSSSREAVGLAVLGNYVFAANEQAGLRVVDISDPAWPQALAGYGAPGGSTDAVAVYGSYVLTADSTGGLKVYDATSVASWSASGQAAIFTSGAPATDLAVRGNFAYVARGSSGLQVWDISDPRNPVLVGTLIETGFAPLRLTVYKGFLYAIDGTSKLYVVTLIS